jgi:hypothetical protein
VLGHQNRSGAEIGPTWIGHDTHRTSNHARAAAETSALVIPFGVGRMSPEGLVFSYVVSAFRRTFRGPAKAGHYVFMRYVFRR